MRKFPANSSFSFTLEEWQSVMKLASLYEMAKVKTLVIDKMESLLVNLPSLQIHLARTYNIQKWLAPALYRLAQRTKPLGEEDVRLVGLSDSLKICALREKLSRCKKCGAGIHSGDFMREIGRAFDIRDFDLLSSALQNANLEVSVETWVTDDEHQNAKAEKATALLPIITVTKQPEPAKVSKPAAQPSPFGFKAPGEKPATSTTSTAPLFPAAATTSTPSCSFRPGATPFILPIKPVEEAKSGEQKPKPSPFVMPGSFGASAPVTNPVPAAPTTPLFLLPNPVAQSEQKKPDSSGQSSGASLLSRLGDVAHAGAPSSTPMFSFPKRSAAPKSFFGATSITTSAPATQPTQSQPVPPITAPSTTPQLKFDFKIKNKPAAHPISPTPDVAKPAMFSFKTPAAAPDATASSSATTAVPKFAFGLPGASEAPGDVKKDLFSFPRTNPGTSNGSPSGVAGFSGFGTNIPSPSTATSDAAPKLFAFATGSGNISGTGGQSPFETKLPEPPKFSFGLTPSPDAAEANSARTTTDGTKNPFSFSNTPAAQTMAPTTLPRLSFDTSNSLNKAGATEGAEAAFTAAPTSNAPPPSTVKFGATSVPSG